MPSQASPLWRTPSPYVNTSPTPSEIRGIRRAGVPLGRYAGEPVTIRLADGDSDRIVLTSVGALAAKGTTGKPWDFSSKSDGVKRVALVDDTKKHPGMFTIAIATKKWFCAALADRPAADAAVTVTIGSQCLSHAVTKKTD